MFCVDIELKQFKKVVLMNLSRRYSKNKLVLEQEVVRLRNSEEQKTILTLKQRIKNWQLKNEKKNR